jgi:hypothetical protein
VTRAELRTLVYELVGRPSTYARLTTTQIDAYVAEGMMRFAQETLPPSLVDFVTVALASGTASYAITGSPLRILSVAVSGVPLTPTTLQRLYVTYPAFQSASNATPTHWMAMLRDASGNPKLTFYPTPDATVNASVAVLKKPAALPSSGSILEWDDLEQHAFAYFAAWRHFQNKTEQDQDDFAAKMLANYKDIEGNYRRYNSLDSFVTQESLSQAIGRTPMQQGGQ